MLCKIDPWRKVREHELPPTASRHTLQAAHARAEKASMPFESSSSSGFSSFFASSVGFSDVDDVADKSACAQSQAVQPRAPYYRPWAGRLTSGVRRTAGRLRSFGSGLGRLCSFRSGLGLGLLLFGSGLLRLHNRQVADPRYWEPGARGGDHEPSVGMIGIGAHVAPRTRSPPPSASSRSSSASSSLPSGTAMC